MHESEEENEKKIEIIEFNGEKLSLINFRCSTIIIIILIMSVLGYITFLAFYPSTLAVFISLGIILIVALYLSSISSTSGMLRKFAITDSRIEIFLPKKEPFTINWQEFNSIKITLKVLDIKPFNVYSIDFIQGQFKKTINIGLQDFRKEKMREIMQILKAQTRLRKKGFKATKEKIVSGIYIVEDLDI